MPRIAAATATLDVTDKKQLAKAVRHLAKECTIIETAHARVGVPEWRTRQGDYAGLARIIAFQQLSTKAAGTIWGRVEVLLGKVTPKAVLVADIDAPTFARSPRRSRTDRSTSAAWKKNPTMTPAPSWSP
jgi:3-methyladenine DNA glycosylase/8-oxoguanine DNA glycosylase